MKTDMTNPMGICIMHSIGCMNIHSLYPLCYIYIYIYMTTTLLTSEEPEKLMVQHQEPQFLPCSLPNHHRTWHKIQSYL